jgi:hypothetical protein
MFRRLGRYAMLHGHVRDLGWGSFRVSFRVSRCGENRVQICFRPCACLACTLAARSLSLSLSLCLSLSLSLSLSLTLCIHCGFRS